MIKKIENVAKKYYSKLPYHNWNHAKKVRSNALELVERCRKYKVPVDSEVVEIAALFHDAGYADVKENKEEHSAKIARKALKKYKYPDSKIKAVINTILATKKNGQLKTNEQKIMRAADLRSFTSSFKEFKKASDKIRREYKILYGNSDFPLKGWTELVDAYLKPKIKLTTEYSSDKFHTKAKNNIKRILREYKKT